MAVRGSLRHVIPLLAALLALTAVAAPLARAQSPAGPWQSDPSAQTDGDFWDGSADGGWEEPSDTTGQPVQTVPVPEIPGVELPATPWQPPTPAPTPSIPSLPVPKAKIIPGRRALIRADGKAAIPRGAPKRVRVAIAWANRIIGKPYKWGGGHARLVDSGYDCSGSVGFALVHAGLMRGVMVSGAMARIWNGGSGKWVTIFANKGHVYMEIAGLRLDTSPYGDPTGRMGVRWRQPIGKRRGFSARHPAGL